MANPYLQDQQNAISNQVNTALLQQQMPSINRGAVLNGGYGGSRQGIAQGLAMNGANQAIANATAQMQGQAYDADQSRANQASIAAMQDATNRFGMQNQYNLGLGNLGLGYTQANQNFALGQGNLGLGFQNSNNQYALGQQQNANQLTGIQNQYSLGQQQNQTTRDLGFGQLGNTATANNQNFYTNQRGQDLQAQGQGFNQYLAALNAQMGIGQGIAGIGQQQFNAPGTVLGQYGNMVSPFTGLNQTNTNTQPQTGGGLAGAAGGALTLAQLLKLLNGG